MPRRSRRIAEKRYDAASEDFRSAGPSTSPAAHPPGQPPVLPPPDQPPVLTPDLPAQAFSSGSEIGRFKHLKFVLKELRPKRKIKDFGTKLFSFKLEQEQQGEKKNDVKLDSGSLDWLYTSLEKCLKIIRTKFNPKDNPKVQLTITFQNLGQRFISVQAQNLFSRTAKSALVDWMVRKTTLKY